MVSQVGLIKKLIMFNFEKIEVKITFLRACLLFLKIFPEVLCQFDRALSHFVGPELPLIAVVIGFSSRPTQKVINV